MSSGISFRQLPEATLAQIVKACQHYEEKCSGSYSPASPSARYVYDLSRDVQDLVRVLKLQEDGLANRVRELEHLVREWQGVFGAPDAALGRLGISAASGTNSPHHIARRLLALAAEIEDERTRHAPADSRHAHEVAELRAALRDTGRVSREQATYEVAALQAAARAAVEEERRARRKAESELQDERAGAAATIMAQARQSVGDGRARKPARRPPSPCRWPSASTPSARALQRTQLLPAQPLMPRSGACKQSCSSRAVAPTYLMRTPLRSAAHRVPPSTTTRRPWRPSRSSSQRPEHLPPLRPPRCARSSRRRAPNGHAH